METADQPDVPLGNAALTAASIADYFAADRPIDRRAQDLLGRSHFATRLARAVADWRGKDSLVIALYGPWGSGKSSIKNMAVEALAKHLGPDSGQSRVVNFNPWGFSGEGQLTLAFFRELAASLGMPGYGPEYRALARKLRALGEYLSSAAMVFSGLRTVVLLTLGVLAALLFVVGLAPAPWIRTTSIVVGLLFELLVLAYAAYGKVFHGLTKGLRAYLHSHQKPLSEHKADIQRELHNILGGGKGPLVVVIDDVDRLTSAETRQMLKLIKINADFAGIVYLLLCQRETVEKCLSDGGSLPGREFLEKIVQVPFDVPALSRSKLESILFEGLNGVLAPPQIERRFDKQRWSNMFAGGMRHYFQNLRHVRRYLAGLAFHAGAFDNEGTFEVNPTDLIALEALRVFEPELYKALASAKDLLTNNPQHTVITGRSGNDFKDDVLSLLNLVDGSRREWAQEIVHVLFPFTSSALGKGHAAANEETWVREMRVCSPAFFDQYFQFALQEDELTQRDMEHIIANAGNREPLVRHLKALNERGLLGEALDRLEAYKQKIPLEHAVPFVSSLFEIGDELPEGQRGFFTISPEMHAIRIVYWHLRQEPEVRNRSVLLKAAFESGAGLYLPVASVATELQGLSKKEVDENERLFPDGQVEDFRKLALSRIERAAASNSLAESQHLGYLLYRWSEFAGFDAPKLWTRRLCSTPEGAFRLIEAFTQETQSISEGDRVARVRKKVGLKDIERFNADLSAIEQQNSTLNVSTLTDAQRETLEVFRRRLADHRAGKFDEHDLFYDE